MTLGLCHQLFNGWENDPAIYYDKTLYKPYVYDKEAVDQYFAETQSNDKVVFAIMLDDEPIGEVQLKKINYDTKECTLSIHMKNDDYKNKGYGTTAENLAVDYAFNMLNMRVIHADVTRGNLRSSHVLRKIGFHIVSDDYEKEQYIMLSEDYHAVKRKVCKDESEKAIRRKDILTRILWGVAVLGICVIFALCFKDKEHSTDLITLISILIAVPGCVIGPMNFKNIFVHFKNHQQEKKNDQTIREQYHIPEDINIGERKGYASKRSLILGIIFSSLGVLSAIVSLFFEVLDYDQLFFLFLIIGFVLIVYGLCGMFGKWLIGLMHSTIPIMCFLVPFFVLYYINRVDMNNGAVYFHTVLLGGLVLLSVYFTFSLFLPCKKRVKIEKEFYAMRPQKDLNIKNAFINKELHCLILNYYTCTVYVLWSNSKGTISLHGDVTYKKQIIKDAFIKDLTIEGSFQDAINEAIDLLRDTIKK